MSKNIISLFAILLLPVLGFAQKQTINAGVATIDITPQWPMRLAGFGVRPKREADGTALPLHAKALALGSNYNNTAILITLDLIGINKKITDSVKSRLSKLVKPERITIAVSHTHSGPEIGTLLNVLPYEGGKAFNDQLLPADQISKINLYVAELINKIEAVSLEAIKTRKPGYIAWGKGHVDFSFNRRNRPDAIDQDMPLMRITDLQGNLKAVFLSYACHAVSLGGGFMKYHGDWVGAAQKIIEERHPGAIAMVAVGCGGDLNPKKQNTTNNTEAEAIVVAQEYGRNIADEADRLLLTKLTALPQLPVIKYKTIELPFSHVPNINELSQMIKTNTVKGFYARLALERIARGEKLPQSVTYPLQTWQFGNKLNIVFLGGEVVADYSIRLKKEITKVPMWIVAYSNDVPCYIASKRIIKTNDYEAQLSMYYYDKPSKLNENVEDQIINTIHGLLK